MLHCILYIRITTSLVLSNNTIGFNKHTKPIFGFQLRLIWLRPHAKSSETYQYIEEKSKKAILFFDISISSIIYYQSVLTWPGESDRADFKPVVFSYVRFVSGELKCCGNWFYDVPDLSNFAPIWPTVDLNKISLVGLQIRSRLDKSRASSIL